jgi:hypothetical protein
MPDVGACLLLTVLCLAFFWPTLAGRVLLPADGIYFLDPLFAAHRPPSVPERMNLTLTPDLVCQHYVWRQFTATSLRSGYVPLWNPYSGCGMPFLANDQSAVLNPLNFLLNLALSPARAQTAFALLTLLGACLFTYGLVRALGGSPVGGVLAGLTFGFGGFIFIWLGYPLAATAAWLPALLWATHRLAVRSTVLGAVAVGGIIGWQFLAGHVSTSVQMLGFWGVFAAYEAAARRRTQVRGGGRRFAGLMVMGLILGLGLGAPQLVPVGESFGLSVLSGEGRSRWGSESLSQSMIKGLLGDGWFLRRIAPGEAALLLLPDRHGHPAFADYRQHPGYGNYAERASYVGTVALCALLIGLFQRPPRGHRRFFLVAAWVVFGILLHLPVLNLVTYLPVLRFAAPQRMRFIFALCAAVSLGFAAADWLSWRSGDVKRPRAPIWAAPAALAVVSGLLGGLTLPLLAAPDAALARSEEWLRLAKLFAPAAAAAALALLLFVMGRTPTRRGMIAVALASAVVFDLFLFGSRWHSTAPANEVLPEQAAIGEIRRLAGASRITGPPDILPPNLAVGYRIYDTRVYDPIAVGRFAALAATLAGRDPRAAPELLKGSEKPVPGLVRLASIRYAWQRDQARGARIVAVARGLPRAYVAPRAQACAGEQALRELVRGPDPAEVTLIEDPSANAPGTGGRIAPAELLSYSPHRVRLRATSARPAWLVLTDTYYPGWRATVNRRPAPVLIANYAFRAVRIPGGESMVTLTYEPASYRIGLFVGLLAAAVAVAAVSLSLARRARPSLPESA